MYTIVMDEYKNLNTTVRTSILQGSTVDEIQFLYAPETSIINSEDEPNPTITYKYSAILRYECKGVERSLQLLTDEELYKERVRFYVPRSSTFFGNRGRIELWLEITIDTTTTTREYNEETGEIIDETIETETSTFTTRPTALFIEEVPRRKHCPKDEDCNTIRITRGDSLTINVILTDDEGYEYVPVEGDEVWFTVKKSAAADEVLIHKAIDINDLVLDLVEEDTKDLAFGNYRYEIECITVQGDHYTVIKNAPFIITEELD